MYRDPSRIEELIKYAGSDDMDYQNSKHNLIFRYLSDNTSDWDDIMKEIKSSGTFHMIVDIETELISKFLHLADLNSLTTYYHHIMFTTLDLAEITNITGFRISCNITSLQMFEPNNLKINALFAGLNSKKKSIIFRYVPSIAIFLYDTFILLSNTVSKFNHTLLVKTKPAASCDTEQTWPNGLKLMKQLKKTSFYGLSGNIQFDNKNGFRSNITFSIVDCIKNTIDFVIIYIAIYNNHF